MPWFRASSVIFAAWAVVFAFFPHQSNELGAVDDVTSKHAEDWTQIVGLFSLAFAVLLYEAHRSANPDVHRVVARGVLSLTVPCALLMTYWQLIPARRWIRLDIADIALLCLVSYGMVRQGDVLLRRRASVPAGASEPPNKRMQLTRSAMADSRRGPRS
jgi:hypothetical protein